MNLKESLESYRNISLELIEKIKKGEDDYAGLFEKRQSIIENLKDLSFAKEEFTELATNYEILNLEANLQETINIEKAKIRKKINFIKITREARTKYENAQVQMTFFNKKI